MRKVTSTPLIQQLILRPALLVSSLTLLALTMEAAIRIAFYHSNDFAMEMWKYAVQLKRPVSSPNLSFVHVPNRHAFLMGVDVDINSHGLRDYEYPLTKSPGTYRIMMLGDSTTFGWGVQLEATIPKLLERQLNQFHASGIDRFEVLNAGVGNYNTVQELAFYEAVGEAFNPDLIILMFYINDPEPVPRERTGFLLGRSYLAAFGASRFDMLLRRLGRRPSWKTYYKSLYDDDKPGFQACQATLVHLATIAHKRQVLVALQPELHELNEDTYPFKGQHEKVTRLLLAKGVHVVDLLEGLKDRGPESSLWVKAEDVHPNGKANALMAKQLSDWLWTHQYLVASPKPARN